MDIFDILNISEIFHHAVITGTPSLVTLVKLVKLYNVPHLGFYECARIDLFPLLISYLQKEQLNEMHDKSHEQHKKSQSTDISHILTILNKLTLVHNAKSCYL